MGKTKMGCRNRNLVNGGVVYGKAKRWWGSVLNEDKPEQVEFDVMAESLSIKICWSENVNGQQENGKQLTAVSFSAKLICCRLLRTTLSFFLLFIRTLRKMMLGMQCCSENVVELMK